MKIEFKFDFGDFNREVQREQKRVIRTVFANNIDRLERVIKSKFEVKVRNSPTYRELISGNSQLLYALGIPNVSRKLTNVINKLIENVQVKLRRVYNDDSDYIIPIEIVLVDEKFNGILRDSEASYFEVNAIGQNYTIPWLKWLLTAGNSTVVVGYNVIYAKRRDMKGSRTGGALMVKGLGDYKVDSEWAGTENDNFIVNAARTMEKELEDIIKKEVVSKL